MLPVLTDVFLRGHDRVWCTCAKSWRLRTHVLACRMQPMKFFDDSYRVMFFVNTKMQPCNTQFHLCVSRVPYNYNHSMCASKLTCMHLEACVETQQTVSSTCILHVCKNSCLNHRIRFRLHHVRFEQGFGLGRQKRQRMAQDDATHRDSSCTMHQMQRCTLFTLHTTACFIAQHGSGACGPFFCPGFVASRFGPVKLQVMHVLCRQPHTMMCTRLHAHDVHLIICTARKHELTSWFATRRRPRHQGGV